LENLLSRYGEVESVKIIVDRDSGCSTGGFDFVKMEDLAAAAVKAVEGFP
jgi:hypothetical protein